GPLLPLPPAVGRPPDRARARARTRRRAALDRGAHRLLRRRPLPRDDERARLPALPAAVLPAEGAAPRAARVGPALRRSGRALRGLRRRLAHAPLRPAHVRDLLAAAAAREVRRLPRPRRRRLPVGDAAAALEAAGVGPEARHARLRARRLRRDP